MSKLVELLRATPDVLYVKGCTDSQIELAQNELNMVFPKEYQDFLRNFGAMRFDGHEWFGLNVSGYLNVVDATKQEISVNPSFPANCFVLEDLGIDAKLIIVDETETVYLLQRTKKNKIADSISSYYLMLTQNA